MDTAFQINYVRRGQIGWRGNELNLEKKIVSRFTKNIFNAFKREKLTNDECDPHDRYGVLYFQTNDLKLLQLNKVMNGH